MAITNEAQRLAPFLEGLEKRNSKGGSNMFPLLSDFMNLAVFMFHAP